MVHMMWASKHFHELDDDFVANQPVIDDVKMAYRMEAVWQYFGSANFSLLHLKTNNHEGKLGLKKLKLGRKGEVGG